MIIYTDLHNRTKNYNLSEEIINNIESEFNVTITTILNPNAEIYWGDKITNHHLNVMSNLKWIHLSKTGFGKFNLPSNITVTNTPKSSNGVAEYAVTGVLYLLRGLDRMTLDRKSFDKNIENIIPFSKVKCLVVGNGRIGKSISHMLMSLGMSVDVKTRTNSIQNYNIYNFVINALPLNDTTLNYFNENFLGKLNKNTYIINVGRGETIDEDVLYDYLSNNKIRGAFLDVVKNEPIQKENKLLSLNNVFISPHIANALYNSIDIQVTEFKNNLNLYKNNKKLNNII